MTIVHAACFHILHVSHEILIHAKQHFIQNMKFYKTIIFTVSHGNLLHAK